MRLTFLNPVGVIGGGERVLMSAIRGARDAFPGVHLDVVLLGPGPLEAACAALGCTVAVEPLPSRLSSLGDSRGGRLRPFLTALRDTPAAVDFLRKLRHRLRHLRPDLIHINGFKAQAIGALACPTGVPITWHLQDFLSSRSLMGRGLRHLSRGVVGVVADSDALRRDAIPLLPGLPITVVENAIDTEHFSPGNADGADLDRMAGLPTAPPGVVRVGLVATYAHWKGHRVFLEAIARVPGVRGYIVGGPIYATAGSQVTRAELEQTIRDLGIHDRVGLIPFQPDPAAIYRRLDVVVHASTQPEPFGLTIVEAMSCGRAVIVAAAGGAAELFTEGFDARGHTPGDVTSLSQVIAELAADSTMRARHGSQARLSAVTRFHQARYTRQIADFWRSTGRLPA